MTFRIQFILGGTDGYWVICGFLLRDQFFEWPKFTFCCSFKTIKTAGSFVKCMLCVKQKKPL